MVRKDFLRLMYVSEREILTTQHLDTSTKMETSAHTGMNQNNYEYVCLFRLTRMSSYPEL